MPFQCQNPSPSRKQESVVNDKCTSTEFFGTHHLAFSHGLTAVQMCEECYEDWNKSGGGE